MHNMTPSPPPRPGGPLRDERVLDLSTTVAGRFCAKLLADLGADVVKVDRPGPDADGDVAGLAERLYFDSSKRSVTLDLGTATDRDVVLGLVVDRDVVIADGPESRLVDLGLDLAALRRVNPAVILTLVSGFGSAGPLATYRTSHIVTCALGTWAQTCGTPDREPLQAGAQTTETVTGAYAASATLGAIEGRARHGQGDRVDVSGWEAAITCAMGPTATYQRSGAIDTRHSDFMTGPSFNIRCRDGYVGVNALTEVQWQTACLFAGRPDMADDPRFGDFYGRLEFVEEIREVFQTAFGERSAQEVFEEAQQWRLPFGLVVSPAQALDLPSHAERAYLVPQEHPTAGTYVAPRVPFLMSATPSTTTPAPVPGQHDAEIRDEARRAAGRVPRPHGCGDDPAGPLDGIRILDLTMFMSGPLATLIAADLGADVIKIEAVQRLDGWRGVGRGGLRPWENSVIWNWINRSKRGVTLNLAEARGADLFRRLVAQSDVVIENYTPRVMRNFGLDHDTLRSIKDDLIMISMPGFGTQGSCSDYAAFAWTTEQMSTITHLTGYPDGDPLFTGTTFGDPLAGLMGSLALLAALNHRRRTGEGQFVDLSQVEASTAFVGEKLIETQLAGADLTRVGNANPTSSPHGIYPCADDRWLAIACADDDQWQAVWAELGDDGPVPFPTRAERLTHRDDVDRLVAAATARGDAFALMHRLQSVGVPAGAVMDGRDLLEEPHLSGWFVDHDRAELGVLRHPGQAFHYRHARLPEPRRAAYLGEHNDEVLRGMLGVDADTFAALERDAIIGWAPLGVDVPRPEVPAD
jgi:crotonobetainyl-CoA:carnitine CoA-transferase CaiB-like acyl-CoA transferase